VFIEDKQEEVPGWGSWRLKAEIGKRKAESGRREKRGSPFLPWREKRNGGSAVTAID
jgi:hypothetical protein